MLVRVTNHRFSLLRHRRLVVNISKRKYGTKVRVIPTMMTDNTRLSILTSVFVAALTSTRCLAAEPVEIPSVRLRVDDYAVVAAGVLARAQKEVTELYASIGVETRWLMTRHLPTGPGGPLRVDTGTPDLTVIVLNPTMTTRMAPPPDAVGLAAQTPSESGRIAYVFYDRLQTATLNRERSDIAALGLVMAHEIGHLLLPYGSHSEGGVMRGHWDLDKFRRLDIRRLRFTALQGQQIRLMLGSLTGH